MEFEIRDNVPAPMVSRKAGRGYKYPFPKLVKVGQSFVKRFETADKKEQSRLERNLRVATSTYNNSHPDKDTELNVYRLEENGLVIGVGVWRQTKTTEVKKTEKSENKAVKAPVSAKKVAKAKPESLSNNFKFSDGNVAASATA